MFFFIVSTLFTIPHQIPHLLYLKIIHLQSQHLSLVWPSRITSKDILISGNPRICSYHFLATRTIPNIFFCIAALCDFIYCAISTPAKATKIFSAYFRQLNCSLGLVVKITSNFPTFPHKLPYLGN